MFNSFQFNHKVSNEVKLEKRFEESKELNRFEERSRAAKLNRLENVLESK
jgi:hypothetical protein